jgi:hypothetical protein
VLDFADFNAPPSGTYEFLKEAGAVEVKYTTEERWAQICALEDNLYQLLEQARTSD